MYTEIRQTLSAESRETSEIQQTSSVESLAPSLIGAPTSPAKLAAPFQIGSSQYVTLLALNIAAARRVYQIEAARNGRSVRELKRQPDSPLYERLALSRDKHGVRRLAREGQVIEKVSDLIKDPVVLEFLGLEERPAYSEKKPRSSTGVISFCWNSARGSCLRCAISASDLTTVTSSSTWPFYNCLFRCYVLIDRKSGKLTHRDLGQVKMYVSCFDRYVKTDDELPTIGFLLCNRKNDAVVLLTLPEHVNVFASKYQNYLPSKRELADQLARVRWEVGGRESASHE